MRVYPYNSRGITMMEWPIDRLLFLHLEQLSSTFRALAIDALAALLALFWGLVADCDALGLSPSSYFGHLALGSGGNVLDSLLGVFDGFLRTPNHL